MGGAVIPLIDATTGVRGNVAASDATDVDAAVAAASRAVRGPWGARRGERASVLERAADLLEDELSICGGGITGHGQAARLATVLDVPRAVISAHCG